MITAKEIRKKLKIPEKIKICDMLLRYFDQEMNKVLCYIDNQDGPFGLLFSLNQVLKHYNCAYCVTCEKKEITKEIDTFTKAVEKLGYFVQYRYAPNDIEFTICWTKVKNINDIDEKKENKK